MFYDILKLLFERLFFGFWSFSVIWCLGFDIVWMLVIPCWILDVEEKVLSELKLKVPKVNI